MHYTQAVILKQRNFKENDKIVSFYTKNFGKTEILAKSSRKISSKLNPHLQEFALLEIGFVKGRNLDRLTSAVISRSYSEIKTSFKTIMLGKFCLETIDGLTKPFHSDKRIFNLLIDLFGNIAIKSGASFETRTFFDRGAGGLVIGSAFLIKLLSFLGYEPELRLCLKCGNKIKEEKNYFDFKKGGLICPKCHKKNELALPISVEGIKLLRLFLSKELKIVKKIKAGEEILMEASEIIASFLKFHQELNSGQFFRCAFIQS